MIISRDVTKAIVVFGLQLGDKGELTPLLRARIEKAAQLHQEGVARYVVFCGHHPLKRPDLGKYPEASAMQNYFLRIYPKVDPRLVYKEERSLSTTDNLIFLHQGFPELRHITLVTQSMLEPRLKFLYEMIYGSLSGIEFVSLPSKSSDFPGELLLFDDMRCTFAKYIPGGYTPGDFKSLIKPDGTTRWDDLRRAHHRCEFWQRKIRHPEFS